MCARALAVLVIVCCHTDFLAALVDYIYFCFDIHSFNVTYKQTICIEQTG